MGFVDTISRIVYISLNSGAMLSGVMLVVPWPINRVSRSPRTTGPSNPERPPPSPGSATRPAAMLPASHPSPGCPGAEYASRRTTLRSTVIMFAHSLTCTVRPIDATVRPAESWPKSVTTARSASPPPHPPLSLCLLLPSVSLFALLLCCSLPPTSTRSICSCLPPPPSAPCPLPPSARLRSFPSAVSLCHALCQPQCRYQSTCDTAGSRLSLYVSISSLKFAPHMPALARNTECILRPLQIASMTIVANRSAEAVRQLSGHHFCRLFGCTMRDFLALYSRPLSRALRVQAAEVQAAESSLMAVISLQPKGHLNVVDRLFVSCHDLSSSIPAAWFPRAFSSCYWCCMLARPLPPQQSKI